MDWQGTSSLQAKGLEFCCLGSAEAASGVKIPPYLVQALSTQWVQGDGDKGDPWQLHRRTKKETPIGMVARSCL